MIFMHSHHSRKEIDSDKVIFLFSHLKTNFTMNLDIRRFVILSKLKFICGFVSI